MPIISHARRRLPEEDAPRAQCTEREAKNPPASENPRSRAHAVLLAERAACLCAPRVRSITFAQKNPRFLCNRDGLSGRTRMKQGRPQKAGCARESCPLVDLWIKAGLQKSSSSCRMTANISSLPVTFPSCFRTELFFRSLAILASALR